MAVIRCESCGKYWDVDSLVFAGVPPTLPNTKGYMFCCPNGHFSTFREESSLIVDAPSIPLTLIPPLSSISATSLLKSELEWVKKQTVKLYDCGYLQTMLGDEKNPLPYIDLSIVEKPEESSRIRDSDGNRYRLVQSPNGITYYVKEEK